MGFESHSPFPLPDDHTKAIWRYMDLSKFLSIITESKLYFSQLSQLDKFDPFEGYFTNANLRVEELKYTDVPEDWKTVGGITDENLFNLWKKNQVEIRKFVKVNRNAVYVNPWHLFECEYAAMWNQYANNDIGIAIKSTIERLIAAINECKTYQIFVGQVTYLDYNRESIPMRNVLLPFMHKRKSFEYEHEIRALIWKTDDIGKWIKEINVPNSSGLYIPINVDTLIESIFVSPKTNEWQIHLVSNIMEKYGLQKKIIVSDLASRPIY